MLILALTGGTGCGKSTAADVLRKCGADIIDADQISRKLTSPNGQALPFLYKAFGKEIFDKHGQLDRKKLGNMVFSDPAALNKLNSILHPLIKTEMDRCLSEARKSGIKMVVLDIPLLYEAGMEGMADFVLCMTVPEQVQLERIMERDGITEDVAKKRIASQMPNAEKAARADFTVSSDRSMEETAAEIRFLYDKLMKEDAQ